VLFLSWDWDCVPAEERGCYIDNMLIRFLLFWAFSAGMLLINQRWLKNTRLVGRILPNVVLTVVAFAFYKGITALICTGFDGRPIILTFQFFVMGMMSMMLGFANYLSIIHQKKEEELQQLKIESLESRCTALTNQINPHFFFNSLGGISSLVRKKDDRLTLDYIDHLSDIFRYILQSERKGLVTLEEELEFARSFCEVMEVRYAGKLDVHIDVPDDCLTLQIPVLALLPLIENVTVHNMIDSEHRMRINIVMNEAKVLVVSNPIYPKQFKPDTHGTGLSNLEKRFSLLTNRRIKIEKNDKEFKVLLPLA
jgi:LytS/YehU family sensor histidine kinase